MQWYTVMKFLHVLSVIAGVGGLFARQVLRQQALRTDDVRSFADFNHAALQLDQLMVIPAMSAILVFGVITALLGGDPIFGFLQGASQNWLLVSNLLVIGIVAIVPTVFIPRRKKMEPMIEAALELGKVTPELRDAMRDSVAGLAHLYEDAALVVVVALMVLKPF